jgi:hypothetical protein
MTTLVLIASVGSQTVAIDATAIESVTDLTTVVPVPFAPEHVHGLSALRSQVATVVDFGRAAGGKPGQASGRALVVHYEGHRYALRVDSVEDVIASVRTQVLRYRNQARKNPRRPALHPDLNIIQYEPGATAANAANRPASTTNGMDNPLGLTDDELAWLREQAGEMPWSWQTGIDADDLLLAATERLWDTGPDYLRSDRVARVDRDRNVRVNVRRGDDDRPVVLGHATPFSYYCTVTVPVDWPESVLAGGWAEIDGHFVIEILSRDESDRPATVRVLEIADDGNDQIDGDGIRMPFGVQYVGAVAAVDHAGPVPVLADVHKEPGGYTDLLPMDPAAWGTDA